MMFIKTATTLEIWSYLTYITTSRDHIKLQITLSVIALNGSHYIFHKEMFLSLSFFLPLYSRGRFCQTFSPNEKTSAQGVWQTTRPFNFTNILQQTAQANLIIFWPEICQKIVKTAQKCWWNRPQIFFLISFN
jgi:hypothetical protein